MEKDSSSLSFFSSSLADCVAGNQNIQEEEVTYEACVRDPRQVIRNNSDGTKTFGKYDPFTKLFIPN